MTKEETTKRFKKWAQQTIGNHGSDEDVQMFENILTLLEQEPCDDCISRKATLEPYRVLENTDTLCVALIRANIKQQPPVAPKKKMGRWIEHENSCIAYIECSECSACFSRTYLLRNSYCPNCGAKMSELQGKG